VSAPEGQRNGQDWCDGCASAPEAQQVNLPEGWTEGDQLPRGLTLHWTVRDPRTFAFIGCKARQQRHYFTKDGVALSPAAVRATCAA
jgi:hypothetical protein